MDKRLDPVNVYDLSLWGVRVFQVECYGINNFPNNVRTGPVAMELR